MRVIDDSVLEKMSREELINEFNRIEETYGDNETCDDLVSTLKIMQRRRHFTNWHDGSTISNHSHLLFVVKCLYDPAVYLTNEEYKEKTGKLICKNIQENTRLNDTRLFCSE